MKFTRSNPEANLNATDTMLGIIDERIDRSLFFLRPDNEYCDGDWKQETIDELAELRIAQRVLKKLRNEFHMDCIEEAEWEEYQNDLREGRYDELLADLDSFLASVQ